MICRRKLKYCCVPGCKDILSKRHRFPKNKLQLFNQWVKLIGNPKLKERPVDEVYESYRVCNAHFRDTDKVPCSNRGLRQDALPLLCLPETSESIPALTTSSLDTDPAVAIKEEIVEIPEISVEEERTTDLSLEIKEDLSVCRACLLQNNPTISIYDKKEVMGIQRRLCDILAEFTTSTLITEPNGRLPDKICLKCVEELCRAYKFKKMCQRSEKVIMHLHSMKGEGRQIERPLATIYKCEECLETFRFLSLYQNHYDTTHRSSQQCDICGLCFQTRGLLQAHKRKEHSRKPACYPCDLCQRSFKSRDHLRRHMSVHTDEKPYLCNICGKTFTSQYYFKLHLYAHNDVKSYKCRSCDKRFAKAWILLKHIKTHTQEFKCGVCTKTFTTAGSLRIHHRIHTNERPYVCEFCGKAFTQTSALSVHRNIHTQEKRRECRVCHKQIASGPGLLRHMKIHSEEKPFTCTTCGRGFRLKPTLVKHVRTHTGEKPYVCSTCGKGFKQQGGLAIHVQTHCRSSDLL